MARAIPVIDTILNSDLEAQFNQRHTAHQVWEQLQIEIPGCDVGESTVRTYVRIRKAELDGAGKTSSQIALAWMMKMLHSDVPLPVIEKEFPSGTVSSLVGLIKSGGFRERKKALATFRRKSLIRKSEGKTPDAKGIFALRLEGTKRGEKGWWNNQEARARPMLIRLSPITPRPTHRFIPVVPL